MTLQKIDELEAKLTGLKRNMDAYDARRQELVAEMGRLDDGMRTADSIGNTRGYLDMTRQKEALALRHGALTKALDVMQAEQEHDRERLCVLLKIMGGRK